MTDDHADRRSLRQVVVVVVGVATTFSESIFLIKSRSVFARVDSIPIPTTLELLRILRLSYDRKQGVGTALATPNESETRIVDQASSRDTTAQNASRRTHTHLISVATMQRSDTFNGTRVAIFIQSHRGKTWRKISENGTQKHRRCDIFVVKKLDCYRKTILEIWIIQVSDEIYKFVNLCYPLRW